MGWRLAEEIAWARPARPGPEWWTLMDLAQTARDETRQTLPGAEELLLRGKCSKRTLYRRLDSLREQKLITLVQSSGPGTRAVYEIAEDLVPWPTDASVSDTCSDASISDTCSDASVSDTCSDASAEQQVPFPPPTGATFRETGASVSGTPLVTLSSTLSSINPADVVTPSVEGAELAANGAASRQPIEQQTWLALHPRM